MLTRFLLTLLLLWPGSAWAATPTHDATTTASTSFTNQQNPSVSHTRGAVCPNPVALVSVGWQDGTPGTLSSFTYGGAGITHLTGSPLSIGGSGNRLAFGIYKNPSSGAATVQANFSESINGITIRVSTYCNVDQTTSTGTVVTATGGDTTATVNVSSATGELVVDAAWAANGPTLTVGASQTQRYNVVIGSNQVHGGSDEAGAATTTMSWTLGSSQFWGIFGVPLKPSVDVTCGKLSLLGVGC